MLNMLPFIWRCDQSVATAGSYWTHMSGLSCWFIQARKNKATVLMLLLSVICIFHLNILSYVCVYSSETPAVVLSFSLFRAEVGEQQKSDV